MNPYEFVYSSQTVCVKNLCMYPYGYVTSKHKVYVKKQTLELMYSYECVNTYRENGIHSRMLNSVEIILYIFLGNFRSGRLCEFVLKIHIHSI